MFDGFHHAGDPAQQPRLHREMHAEHALKDGFGAGGDGGGIAFGQGVDQQPGVGMLRLGEELCGGGGFNDFALFHHRHAIGDLAHDGEIVGDEEDGHAALGLQFFQQRQDLALQGDIEGGGGFVGDQQGGVVGDGHADHHPLALATGKFVRVGFAAGFEVGEADSIKELVGFALGLGAAGFAVPDIGFDNLPADRVQGVQRTHRLLEDHADVAAAQSGNSDIGFF